MADSYLLIGLEPTDTWPLVPEGRKFNADVTAWTVYRDKETAEAKLEELQSNDEYETEWHLLGRRME